MMDCNYCEHLNLTEKEQRRTSHGNNIPHICTKYNKRVMHRASSRYHDARLYPCEECEKEQVVDKCKPIQGYEYFDPELIKATIDEAKAELVAYKKIRKETTNEDKSK